MYAVNGPAETGEQAVERRGVRPGSAGAGLEAGENAVAIIGQGDDAHAGAGVSSESGPGMETRTATSCAATRIRERGSEPAHTAIADGSKAMQQETD